MASVKAHWKAFSARYVRFVEGQGFMIILAVCVAVIAGTAVWTNQAEQLPPAPTSPAMDAAAAARQLQESLKDVSTPTPAPTQVSPMWQPPLETVSVLQGFEGARLVPSGVTGLWRLHDAVDLRCETGEIIRAMADGTVTAVCAKGLLGACITIDHGQEITAQYAGMELHAGLRAGDPVAAGQTIGFGGNAVLDETDLPPHLHLRVTRDGHAIDPLILLRQ